MKITTRQLREIIREEIRKVTEGNYERIRKNPGYNPDLTAPADYNNDGSDILAAIEDEEDCNECM